MKSASNYWPLLFLNSHRENHHIDTSSNGVCIHRPEWIAWTEANSMSSLSWYRPKKKKKTKIWIRGNNRLWCEPEAMISPSAAKNSATYTIILLSSSLMRCTHNDIVIASDPNASNASCTTNRSRMLCASHYRTLSEFYAANRTEGNLKTCSLLPFGYSANSLNGLRSPYSA